jgi:DNA-binding NtrC family response regulator
VVQIKVPTLKERKEDIPLLVSEFVKEICIKENKAITVSDEVMAIFRNYDWPGNIRQLRNVVERAIVLTKGRKITRRELTEELAMFRKSSNSIDSMITLKEMEGQAIIKALQESMGNKSKAANALGISRKAFYKKLRELEQ